VQGSTGHPITFYCGWAIQFFLFFEFDLQLFFEDLVLIKNQLILIFYENMRLKDEGTK